MNANPLGESCGVDRTRRVLTGRHAPHYNPHLQQGYTIFHEDGYRVLG